MSAQLFPGKILWLASYPKSGNTWFRAFLTALINDGNVDINHLVSDGIFSSRKPFDFVSDIDSRDLYEDEAKLMLADVYRHLAAGKKSLSIIKVHDAYGTDQDGQNLIPEDITHCAVYFIRNPLDIAASLAHHVHIGINDAVNMLNNKNACMACQHNNLNNNAQFRQQLSDWSGHVSSWTLKPPFPVCVVRYEDMLINTFETFSAVLDFIGWHFTPEQVSKAIEATGFEMLSKQEVAHGFNERQRTTRKFFRKGKSGNWENELTAEQVDKIILLNKEMMNKYQYV